MYIYIYIYTEHYIIIHVSNVIKIVFLYNLGGVCRVRSVKCLYYILCTIYIMFMYLSMRTRSRVFDNDNCTVQLNIYCFINHVITVCVCVCIYKLYTPDLYYITICVLVFILDNTHTRSIVHQSRRFAVYRIGFGSYRAICLRYITRFTSVLHRRSNTIFLRTAV